MINPRLVLGFYILREWGWRNGKSARHPVRSHKWVEFVVSSCLASRIFLINQSIFT